MFDRILVPVDGSRTSSKALLQAMALAEMTRGRIRLIEATVGAASTASCWAATRNRSCASHRFLFCWCAMRHRIRKVNSPADSRQAWWHP